MKDTYTVTVKFERQISDDAEILKHQGKVVSAQGLVSQLAEELQQAYDDVGIAGSFQCIGIEFDSEITEEDHKKGAAFSTDPISK